MKLLTLFAVSAALVISPLESKGQEPDSDWKPPGAEEQTAVDEANKRLDAVYNRLMDKLKHLGPDAGPDASEKARTALQKAERSWIKWRDEEAILAALAVNCCIGHGSGFREDFLNAQLKLINQRIEVLNEYSKQFDQ